MQFLFGRMEYDKVYFRDRRRCFRPRQGHHGGLFGTLAEGSRPEGGGAETGSVHQCGSRHHLETVSTDYTCSDKLYFELLCVEDVLNIIHLEQPEGVIASLGGQTAINLAEPLLARGVKIIGTDCDAIERAGNRDVFEKLLFWNTPGSWDWESASSVSSTSSSLWTNRMMSTSLRGIRVLPEPFPSSPRPPDTVWPTSPHWSSWTSVCRSKESLRSVRRKRNAGMSRLPLSPFPSCGEWTPTFRRR